MVMICYVSKSNVTNVSEVYKVMFDFNEPKILNS